MTPDLRELSEAFDRIEAALKAAVSSLPDGDVSELGLLGELCDLRLKAFGLVVRAELLQAKRLRVVKP